LTQNDHDLPAAAPESTARTTASAHLSHHLAQPGQPIRIESRHAEGSLTPGEHAVGQAGRVELLVDPMHHAHRGDPIDFSGPRPVGQAVQGVPGGISRGERGGGGGGVSPWQADGRPEENEPGRGEEAAHVLRNLIAR
jgi:hypothetical protein